ncbi:PAAR domain-containing protein [Pseudomonas sp. zfem002]|uniref:PAAR domain-containing protein n=1 Tax=Pseudomonas sp. zfem002 TaxID=3078197 RepID=UPI002928B5E7|nr:PAAR domain-containing protein [Pseudomonas sp. zfem002]MDU9392164.1 PAAR domain-containing protein [Pseudomonas sp. zfem002]
MTRSTVNGLGQGLHGDETTSGAVCYSSLPNSTQGNRGVLRVGDKTSKCPRCGQQGTIVEGWAGFKWHGAPTALHGAQVQCGCPAGSNRLIAQDPPARSARMASPAAAATSHAAPAAATARNASPVAPAAPFSAEQDNEPAEPGFYIVPKSISRQQLVAELFGDAPSPEVMRKFNGLNGSLGDGIVKAGQMVVLADPRNYMCIREEAHLMAAAEEVSVALADLEPDDADFMVKYRGEIAAVLGETSTWAGVTAAVLEKHMKDITNILIEYQELHQDTYRTHGHFKSREFLEKRRQILAKLDTVLFKSTRIRGFTSLGDHPKLRKSLNVSTKSLVHHWNKAGGPGQIPGYSKYVKSMEKATAYMKTGGYIAIGIGGVSSALLIKEACKTGTNEECTRIALTEGNKFTFSALGGLAAGHAASSLKLCLGRGQKPSIAGYAVCTVTVVGGSSWLGAYGGGHLGNVIGESIHDHFLRD